MSHEDAIPDTSLFVSSTTGHVPSQPLVTAPASDADTTSASTRVDVVSILKNVHQVAALHAENRSKAAREERQQHQRQTVTMVQDKFTQLTPQQIQSLVTDELARAVDRESKENIGSATLPWSALGFTPSECGQIELLDTKHMEELAKWFMTHYNLVVTSTDIATPAQARLKCFRRWRSVIAVIIVGIVIIVVAVLYRR